MVSAAQRLTLMIIPFAGLAPFGIAHRETNQKETFSTRMVELLGECCVTHLSVLSH